MELQSKMYCEAHEREIKDIRKTLYGNGREGIVSKVNRIDIILRIVVFLLGPCFLAASGFIVQFIFEKLTGA
jgi:hypothetical protein